MSSVRIGSRLDARFAIRGSTFFSTSPIPLRKSCTNGIQSSRVCVMTGWMASKVSVRIGASAVSALAIVEAIGSSVTSEERLICSRALPRSLYLTSLMCWSASAPS